MPGESEDPVTKQQGNSVLCIGNDPVALNIRCHSLKEHGWHVLSSGSAHEGIIRFGQESVDAVVVDLNSDGVESALVTGELKRLRSAVPVILLVEERNKLADGATVVADAVVAKSEQVRVLIGVLRTLLGTSR
jgi:DNA-binding response OmpR family regulator